MEKNAPALELFGGQLEPRRDMAVAAEGTERTAPTAVEITTPSHARYTTHCVSIVLPECRAMSNTLSDVAAVPSLT
jgi:hypothetical protein